MTFVGAVLTGGASRRMGRDKAGLPIGGVPMALRVAAALRGAGAAAVALVGRPVPGVSDAGPGAEHVADLHPGAGPLGGVLTALTWAGARTVVVAPCDLVAPDPDALALLVAALDPSTNAVAPPLAAVAGPRDPLPLALGPDAAAVLAAAFAAGERALHRALGPLAPVDAGLPPAATRGANSRDELPPGAG